jgi:hypothetical protein
VGDTFPPVYLEVSDETGLRNLTSAISVEVQFVGKLYVFSSVGAAIWPAQTDPDGVHLYNLMCPLTTGDTANVDIFDIFIVVTWASGQVQTFACTDNLAVKAMS